MKKALSAILLLGAIACPAFADDISSLPPREKRWALVVGVDQYDDPQLNLSGAAKDAKTLRDALIETAGFPAEQVILLATGEPPDRVPTRGKILGRLTSLLTKLVPRDGLFLFAFSGHGIERDHQVYLYPSDVEKSDDVSLLQQTAVSVEWIRQRVEANRISQVLFLLDACRNDPGGRANVPNKLTEAYVDAFRFDTRNEGVRAFATLFASAVNQRAYEYKQKKQGYFTWAVVEGLRGAAANERGEVTLSALVKFVEDTVPMRVARDLGYDQQPYSKFEGYRAQELVLSVVPKKKEPPGVAAPEPVRTVVDPSVIELRFWESVEKLGTTAAYEEYLKRYPNGIYANLARMMAAPQSAAYSRLAADQAYEAGDYAKARSILEKGVASGDADAHAGLGKLLYLCLGGPCNFDRARVLLSEAKKRGSREGEGWWAYVEMNCGSDFTAAINWAQAAAERGDLMARLTLIEAYTFGYGVARDRTTSERLCELALPALRKKAEEGEPWAQNRLGVEYFDGTCGLAKDAPKAVGYFQQASLKKEALSMINLAVLYANGWGGVPKDEAKTRELRSMAAAQGNRDALVSLAVLFENGEGPVAKDERKAVDLYRQAMSLGSHEARNRLGQMYERGAGGLQKDVAKAVELYRQGANAGNGWSQMALAYAYDVGEGVPKDAVKAAEWYGRAADENVVAKNNLALMYEDGRGGLQKDLVKAAELFRQAADAGNAESRMNLGRLYEGGLGVEKDLEKAIALYQQAAAEGNEKAKDHLKRLGR